MGLANLYQKLTLIKEKKIKIIIPINILIIWFDAQGSHDPPATEYKSKTPIAEIDVNKRIKNQL